MSKFLSSPFFFRTLVLSSFQSDYYRKEKTKSETSTACHLITGHSFCPTATSQIATGAEKLHDGGYSQTECLNQDEELTEQLFTTLGYANTARMQ